MHTRIRVGAGVTALAASAIITGVATADPGESAAPPGVCKTVADIGDSTSLGMDDPQITPDPDRLSTKYSAVAGVERTLFDAAGGRAVIERVGEASPGLEALAALNESHPDCYVIALGTNDAANEAVGSTVDAAERIDQMMALTNGKPVLWPTVKTLPTATVDGYAPDSMTSFNTALIEATSRHPNLTVYDWASEAADDLFADDGIHYTADGMKLRITKFAEALREISLAHAARQSASSTTDTMPPLPDLESPTPAAADTTTTDTTTTEPAPSAQETSSAPTSTVTVTDTPDPVTVTVTETPATVTVTETAMPQGVPAQ